MIYFLNSVLLKILKKKKEIGIIEEEYFKMQGGLFKKLLKANLIHYSILFNLYIATRLNWTKPVIFRYAVWSLEWPTWKFLEGIRL